MNHILPQMIPAVCFAVFIGLGNTIDLETAVIAMIYFEKLQWCQNWFPTFLTEYSELNIAFDRIKKFMSIKNVQTNFKTVKKIKGEYALKIKGNFSWGFSDKVNETVNKNTQLRFNKDDKRKLKHYIQIRAADIKIKRGEFVCIIGDVASGKSTLLRTIIGDTLFV